MDLLEPESRRRVLWFVADSFGLSQASQAQPAPRALMNNTPPDARTPPR
jgi:hypothetical protein